MQITINICIYIYIYYIIYIIYVLVCTDHWGKELPYTQRHRYTGEIREPMWWNGSTLAWNARNVGSSSALGTIFPIFVTFMMLLTLYSICAVWLLNLPFACICKCTCIQLHIYIYLYVIVSIKSSNSRGTSVVVCTDIWGQGSAQAGRHGHNGDIREPIWCNDNTLTQRCRFEFSSNPWHIYIYIYIYIYLKSSFPKYNECQYKNWVRNANAKFKDHVLE